jgi:hypothetical protein
MQTANIQPDNTDRLQDAFDALREAIFETYTELAARDRHHPPEIATPAGSRPMTEQERRQSALNWIDGTLQGRPLAAFPAVRLELLELMIDYWREAEVEVGAPPPDPLQ